MTDLYVPYITKARCKWCRISRRVLLFAGMADRNSPINICAPGHTHEWVHD